MSHGSLRTENIFKLAGPIFFQHLTHTVVLLVDLWFFSHLSDEIAGTIGQLLPIIWLGTFVIPVFAGTGVSVASQYMGAKQHDKVVPAYMMNLALTAGLGVAFGGALMLFSHDIGRWMGLPPELSAIGATYLGTISWYFLPMGVLVAYNAVLSSRGMTHWLMYSAFLVASINLVLAWLFVMVFHWGVRGVVSASVVSVTTAMFLSAWLVHVRLDVRFYRQGARRAMLGVLPPMLRLGIPNALEPFSYSVQQIILSKMIIGLGIVSMAANNYAGRLQMLQITFSLALALGGQILLAHWTGARRYAEVDRLFWRMIRWGMTVAGCYACALWLFSNGALGIFTNDPTVKQLGRTLLMIAMFYESARAVNIIGGFSLKTVGDARFPVVIGMIFIWGILPVVWAVNHYWSLTLVGFWLFFAVDEIVRAAINLWRWRTGKWKTMGIAHHGDAPLMPPPEALQSEF